MSMDQLISQRRVIKAKNTRMINFLTQLETNQNKIVEIPARLNKYENNLSEFEIVQMKIEELDPQELTSNERENFEATYFGIITKCNALVEKLNQEQASASSSKSRLSSHSTMTSNVKLPTIELPEFNGDYLKWLTFRDIFYSMIDSNEALNDVQKLHYLKSTLKGNAALIIAALPTTATNYTVAWDMIKQRYENNKLLIQAHVDGILDLPSLQKESALSLREFTDNLLRNVRALRSLDKPTDQWNTLLLYIILRKLDPETRRAWELANPSNEEPNFEVLVDFLQTRAQVLENIHHKPEVLKNSGTAKSFVVNYSQYPDCLKSHRIQNCQTFLNKNAWQRVVRARQLKLCLNCLQGNHFLTDCKSSNCRTCGKRHHTLLHLEKRDEPANRSQ